MVNSTPDLSFIFLGFSKFDNILIQIIHQLRKSKGKITQISFFSLIKN